MTSTSMTAVETLHVLSESAQQCLAALKNDSERLADLISALQRQTASLEPLLTSATAAPARDGGLELASARDEVTALRREHQRLESAVADLLKENDHVTQRYVALEMRISRLGNLYVASSRLHETFDQGEVLKIIEEIVVAIVGSEELAIFECVPEATTLSLLASSGVDAEQFRALPLSVGYIGATARTGTLFVADLTTTPASGREAGLTACVPLRLGTKVVGVIAIFHLLPQKKALGPLDLELFELLSTQAAMALYCARRSSEAAR